MKFALALIIALAGTSAVAQESAKDRMMALHAIGVALDTHQTTIWINPQTRSGGKAEVVGRDSNGCDVVRNVLLIGDTKSEENFSACRGGGVGTWIVDQSWVLSTIVMASRNACHDRLMDARLQHGRAQASATICLNSDGNLEVKG